MEMHVHICTYIFNRYSNLNYVNSLKHRDCLMVFEKLKLGLVQSTINISNAYIFVYRYQF